MADSNKPEKSGECIHDEESNNKKKKLADLRVGYKNADRTEMIKFLRTTPIEKYDIGFVKAILYKYMGELKTTLRDDWILNGITIGKRLETINPSHLFDVEETDTPWEGYQSPVAINEEPVIASLLIIFRLSRLSGIDYDSIRALYRRYTFIYQMEPPFCFFEAKAALSWWKNDPDFRKIIAGYDMFLYTFPNLKTNKLRSATVINKLKDGSALSNIAEVRKTLKLKLDSIDSLVRWIHRPMPLDED